MARLHSSDDVRSESPETPAAPSPLERAVRLAFGDRERVRDERILLAEENRRLSAELERLNEENAALREAASIWIRLYEKQLERANRAAHPPSRRIDFRSR